MKLNIFKCALCNDAKEYKRTCDFSHHIQYVHKIMPKEYYDKYLREQNEGICPICGKETTFRSLGMGYAKHCSTKCTSNDPKVREMHNNTMLTRYGYEHALQVPEFKEKQENTTEERHGNKNYYATEKFKTEMHEYNLENFGVEFNWQREDVKEKIKDTKEERYGDRNYVNIEKMKQTKLEKYGDETYFDKEKMLKTKNENYKIKYQKLANDNGQNIRIDSIGRWQINCTCLTCNSEFSIYRAYYKVRISRNEPICLKCNPIVISTVSREESSLYDYIKELSNNVIQSDKNILNGHELDIFLPDKKIAIEYDGLYWHCELNKETTYHLKKTETCEKQGIQLIHVFEDEWLAKPDIVKSRINGLLGLNDRIFARKCIVKEVSYKDSAEFLELNHIQGNCNSKYRYGLYYNDELVSLMTFGKSRFKDEFEMLRFCNKLNTNIVGGASKLFQHFIKNHPEINKIISYADRRWSKGNLYEKIGFNFIENTKPSYYYIKGKVRFNRINFQKHKLVAGGYDPALSEHEIMLSRQFYRIYDCGTKKYEWIRK